jgi:hypothetical protein
MVGVVMMRFVTDAMMVMTRMVLIAPPWVPWATGLCRRKRSSKNDHSECNFQVHDISCRLMGRGGPVSYLAVSGREKCG